MNDNFSTAQKSPVELARLRRLVLILIGSICFSTALISTSGGLIFCMMVLGMFTLRQMLEDEVNISLTNIKTGFRGNLHE